MTGLGAVALGSLVACGDNPQMAIVDAPPGADAASALVLDTTMAMYAALATPGGSLVINTATDKIIVVRASQTEVDALSAICTHAGCTVAYTSSTMKLDCPCHGAQFSLTGQVLKSPATRALEVYQASLSGSLITIALA